MRRLVVAACMAALVLTGCSAPQPPEVTFFAAGTTIRLAPSPACNAETQECQPTGDLAIPGGKLLNISVPGQVADKPWVVVFKFRSPDGAEQKARSAIFKSGEKYAYTLNLPTAGDQLTHVEVQRIAGISADPSQGINFITDAAWSLNVTP